MIETIIYGILESGFEIMVKTERGIFSHLIERLTKRAKALIMTLCNGQLNDQEGLF
jgi:hypothetical protein